MNTRLFLTLAAALVCGIAVADDKKSDGATHVDADAAAKLVEEGKVVVLDVRTADEYNGGHIAGAKNIDFTENDFAEKAGKLDKSKPYLVHCASGRRSTASLEVLQKLGFKSIYHFDGGFKGWEKAGKPVEK
jgi:rhodanese-related sulfurtransferase